MCGGCGAAALGQRCLGTSSAAVPRWRSSALLGCLLLLLKSGVVVGDELVLVRALVVMKQHGLKQMQMLLAKAAEPMASTVKMSTRMGTSTRLILAFQHHARVF